MDRIQYAAIGRRRVRNLSGMCETNGGRGVRWKEGSGGRSYGLEELAMLIEEDEKSAGERVIASCLKRAV